MKDRVYHCSTSFSIIYRRIVSMWLHIIHRLYLAVLLCLLPQYYHFRHFLYTHTHPLSLSLLRERRLQCNGIIIFKRSAVQVVLLLNDVHTTIQKSDLSLDMRVNGSILLIWSTPPRRLAAESQIKSRTLVCFFISSFCVVVIRPIMLIAPKALRKQEQQQ